MKKYLNKISLLSLLFLITSCDTRKRVDDKVYRAFETFITDEVVFGIRYPEYSVDTDIYKDFPIELCLANLCYDIYFGRLRAYYDLDISVSIEVFDDNSVCFFNKFFNSEELKKVEYAIPGSHNEQYFCYNDFKNTLNWSIDLKKHYSSLDGRKGSILFIKENQYRKECYCYPFEFQTIGSLLEFKLDNRKLIV